jgi:hypothetical protein
MARRPTASRPPAFAAPPFGDEPSPLAAGLRSVAVAIRRHRRLGAAVCAGVAVVVAVSALTPPSAASPSVTGQREAASLLPTGAGGGPAADADSVAVTVRLADPAGLLLVRAGSHTEVLAGPSGDAPVAAAGTTGSSAEVLSADAVVLAVPKPLVAGSSESVTAGAGGLLGGSGGAAASTGLDGVVVLAVPPEDGRRIAAAAGVRPLSVAVALAPTP